MRNQPVLVLVFALFLALSRTGQSEECSLHYGYDPNESNAPTFFIRAGYSRDNDDPSEGHFETAIFDLELVGHASADGSVVCLYALVTSHLRSENQNAESWARAWFTVGAGLWKLSEQDLQWKPLLNNMGVAPSKVLHFPTTPYADPGQRKMRDEFIRLNEPGQPSIALRTETFLGKLTDGVYSGRLFFQTPTGRDGLGKPVFNNTDDNDYNVVRHVARWRIRLLDGKLSRVTENSPEINRSVAVAGFFNQIRLIQPSWDGTRMTSEGQTEVKYHSVGLVWRDVVEKRESAEGQARYFRTDLYSILREQKAPQPVSEERLERLPEKSSRIPVASVPVPNSITENKRPPGREANGSASAKPTRLSTILQQRAEARRKSAETAPERKRP